MRLAFTLIDFEWYLGGSRDFLRIAKECQCRGHEVVFFTYSWVGEQPNGIEVNLLLPPTRPTFTRKLIDLAKQVKYIAQSQRFDGVIGEHKVPGLDAYYASVPCWAAENKHGPRLKWIRPNHNRRRIASERAVFEPQSKTIILCISEREARTYQRYYGTPDQRLKMLPPTMDPSQKPPVDISREEIRRKHKINGDMQVLLFVGSDYRRKGLDRAIAALSSLEASLQKNTHLFVVGHTKRQQQYETMARRHEVDSNIRFLGARDDVPELMAASDMLMLPSYLENTGGVILEGIVAGLPVLTTQACGYAFHVEKADAGKVIEEPFSQQNMNTMLSYMLTSGEMEQYRKNALEYGKDPGLYQFAEKAADAIEHAVEQKAIR